MNFDGNNSFSNCCLEDISALIDGELDETRQAEVFEHLARCNACSTELTRQKQFLRELEIGLGNDAEFELPSDFTRFIVTNAESAVSGVRRPAELFSSLFISSGLLVFVLFSIGGEWVKTTEWITSGFEKFFAVGHVAGGLVYSILFGMNVIIRGFAAQMHIDSAVRLSVFVFAAAAAIVILRRLLRHYSVQV